MVFDAALKENEASAPVYGAPAAYGSAGSAHQQPVYQAGIPIQQGYQQPTAGWPAYGAPVPGVPMPYGGDFPMRLPEPVAGGIEDEKFQINDTGVATIVPGLEAPKVQRTLVIAVTIVSLVGGILLGFGVVLIKWKLYTVALILLAAAGMEFGLVILMFVFYRKNLPTKHGRIEPEHINRFIDRITQKGATMPQIVAVTHYMSRANPDTPHKFYAWKKEIDAQGNQKVSIVAAEFNLQNATPGTRVQLHMYQLV